MGCSTLFRRCSTLFQGCSTHVKEIGLPPSYSNIYATKSLIGMACEFVKVIFDRRKNVEKRGKGTIEFLVQYNRREKKYYTYCTSVAPKDFEEIKKSQNFQDALKLYSDRASAVSFLGMDLTIENFEKCLKQKPKTGYEYKNPDDSFLDYVRDCMAKERIAFSTLKKKEVALTALESFGRIQKFSDLTSVNLELWDEYLHEPYYEDEKGNKRYRKIPTIANYHKTIHIYTHKAYKLGYIQKDPYDIFEFDRGHNAEREPLTRTEIELIANMSLPIKEGRVRDLFIFSCYTGLSFCDMMEFDFTTMTEKENDMYFIFGERLKTGANFRTPILPPAMRVLERNNFTLPRISNQKGNDYLHLIESRACLNKPLTFHVARHSFATLMLTYKTPMDRVARMMGHTTIKHTARYAKTMPSAIHEEGARLAGIFT